MEDWKNNPEEMTEEPGAGHPDEETVKMAPDEESLPEGEAPKEETEGSGNQEEGEEKPSAQKEEPAKGKKTLKKKRSARELEAALAKSEEQVAELADKYQRLIAEFENARKRTAKETSRMYDMGAKDVLEKMLPVIDNFERGMQTLTEEQKELPFIQGIDKIYKQFLTFLTDCHVEPMDAAGKEFNPDYHNAVMHVEDEELGDNVVAEELLKGYMYKDMVLRHSMVKVAN